jgi:Putative zinc-finger
VNCARVLELIEDYHYGELNRRVADRVKSHLCHCRECSEAVESLEEESRLFRAYARDIEQAELKPVVWEAVRRRIRDLPRSRSGWRDVLLGYSGVAAQPRSGLVLACAATVVILLVSIAVGYRYLDPKHLARGAAEGQGISPGSQEPGGGIARDGAGRGGDSARHRNSIQFAEWSIRRAEEEYLEAIEVLSAALSERKDSIDPQVVASFERDVKAIDRNIAASRKAYRARPRDFDLGQFMLTAYARKLEMLQTLGS